MDDSNRIYALTRKKDTAYSRTRHPFESERAPPDCDQLGPSLELPTSRILRK